MKSEIVVGTIFTGTDYFGQPYVSNGITVTFLKSGKRMSYDQLKERDNHEQWEDILFQTKNLDTCPICGQRMQRTTTLCRRCGTEYF